MIARKGADGNNGTGVLLTVIHLACLIGSCKGLLMCQIESALMHVEVVMTNRENEWEKERRNGRGGICRGRYVTLGMGNGNM